MTRRKKYFSLIIILFLIYNLRGVAYRLFVKYTIMVERSNEYDCKEVRDCRVYLPDTMSLKEELVKVQKYVANSMEFSSKNRSRDAMDVIKSGHGNCIAYARITAAILDCKSYKNLEVKVMVSRISFLGFDLHSLFSNSFFKDHDIVVIRNKSEEEIFIIDPSLFEYTGIKYVCGDF